MTRRAAARFDEKVERIIDVIQELSLAPDLPAVIHTVKREARALTGADGATFVLRDGDLCHYVDEDAIAPLWKGRRFPMETCVSGWVMENRVSAVIEDIYADDRIPADAYRPTFVKSLVMVPIRTISPVGAIGNYWASPYKPGTREVRLLQALADATSVAIGKVDAEAQRRAGGLINMCSHCRKVRDTAGLWHSLEALIARQTNSVISHGICPDCLNEHYSEL